MSDRIQLPTELPLNSLKILLDFGRQRQPWSQTTLAAACTVVLYGVTLAVPAACGLCG
jgi:formate hydrogenlyase subunit 3/multisubunit Na+/H+ antiporter MnhD subunit